MNLSDPKDVKYIYDKHFGELPTVEQDPLEIIEEYTKNFDETIRAASTFDELKTSCICLSISIQKIVQYMRMSVEDQNGRNNESIRRET